MREPHRYEELLPEEFYAELNRAPVAYFGAGAMEEHGLHNALGVDPYIAYEVCLRAAAIAGGVVFPPVPFAPAGVPGYSRQELRSGRYNLYPPSLWVSRELCRQLYLELMESMADLGFRACIGFGGHWPADLLLAELSEELGGVVRGMRFWGGGLVTLLRDSLDAIEAEHPGATGHGMLWETSLVMAMRPDWVEAERARHIKTNPLDSQLKGQPEERLEEIAVSAGADWGRHWLDQAAERLAEISRALLH